MEPLFDEVSRILAQPRPRRATLRLVFSTAAGAAVAALLPGSAFAWAQCGPINCQPGQVCCNSTGICCAAGDCVKQGGEGICCPTGKACGGVCCGTGAVCCSVGSTSVCCESSSQRCGLSSTGASVCEAIVVPPPPPPPICDPAMCSTQHPGFACNTGGQCVCDATACGAILGHACVGGQCVCDQPTCVAAGQAQGSLFTCSLTGVCGPPGIG
jgi:hypothetical protein